MNRALYKYDQVELRAYILHLSLSGFSRPPRERPRNATMRNHFFWPHMGNDIIQHWKIAANAPNMDLQWSIGVNFDYCHLLNHSSLWSSIYWDQYWEQLQVANMWILWPIVIQNPPVNTHLENHIDATCNYIPRQWDTPVRYMKLCIQRQWTPASQKILHDVWFLLKRWKAEAQRLSSAKKLSRRAM